MSGRTGKEEGDFIRLLTTKLGDKIEEPYAIISAWLRTKLSFDILKSALRCVRGSIIIFKMSNCEDYALDLRLKSS